MGEKRSKPMALVKCQFGVFDTHHPQIKLLVQLDPTNISIYVSIQNSSLESRLGGCGLPKPHTGEMIAVAVVLPSDIDRDMIKLWDARLNTRCSTCSRPTRSEMLHRRDQNQVSRPAFRVALPLLFNCPTRPAAS